MGEERSLSYGSSPRRKGVTLAGWIAWGWGGVSVTALAWVVGGVFWGRGTPLSAAGGSWMEWGWGLVMLVVAAALPVGWTLSVALSRRLTDLEMIWLFWASTACGLLTFLVAAQRIF